MESEPEEKVELGMVKISVDGVDRLVYKIPFCLFCLKGLNLDETQGLDVEKASWSDDHGTKKTGIPGGSEMSGERGNKTHESGEGGAGGKSGQEKGTKEAVLGPCFSTELLTLDKFHRAWRHMRGNKVQFTETPPLCIKCGKATLHIADVIEELEKELAALKNNSETPGTKEIIKKALDALQKPGVLNRQPTGIELKKGCIDIVTSDPQPTTKEVVSATADVDNFDDLIELGENFRMTVEQASAGEAAIKQDLGGEQSKNVAGKTKDPYSIKCRHCPQTFRNYKAYNTHLQAHAKSDSEWPPINYACPIEGCTKSFPNRTQLERHKKSVAHVDPKSLICMPCSKRFANKDSLRDHHNVAHKNTVEKNRKFPCDVCGKKFLKSPHLVEHLRIHSGELPFPCTICFKKFRSKSHVTRHMKTHRLEGHIID